MAHLEPGKREAFRGDDSNEDSPFPVNQHSRLQVEEGVESLWDERRVKMLLLTR
jgi:hypothetical protein